MRAGEKALVSRAGPHLAMHLIYHDHPPRMHTEYASASFTALVCRGERRPEKRPRQVPTEWSPLQRPMRPNSLYYQGK